MSHVKEFVLGDTLKGWVHQLVDSRGRWVDPAGGAVKLQASDGAATSPVTIDLSGDLLSAVVKNACTVALGNNVITAPDVVGIYAGYLVTGTGIPASTFVADVGPGNLVKLTNVASASGSPNLTFTPQGHVQFPDVGNAINDSQMGTRDAAIFTGRVKFTNAGGEFGWSALFSFLIVRPPL